MIVNEPNNDDRDGDNDDICKMRLCPQSPRAKSPSYHLSHHPTLHWLSSEHSESKSEDDDDDD